MATGLGHAPRTCVSVLCVTSAGELPSAQGAPRTHYHWQNKYLRLLYIIDRGSAAVA